MAPDSNNRTHEPALREVVAELDGLRDLMDEREKRYDQAIHDLRVWTDERFTSSDKAIGKAEAAQAQYNSAHNDLTRKMDAQYKEMLPRPEAESRFRALEEKLGELRESRHTIEGRSSGVNATSDIVGRVTVILISIAAVVIAAIALIKH